MNPPNVYLVIGPSAIAFEETGEILETVEWSSSYEPDWTDAGICDHRGASGQEGYRALHVALEIAEALAHDAGVEVRRVPREVIA